MLIIVRTTALLLLLVSMALTAYLLIADSRASDWAVLLPILGILSFGFAVLAGQEKNELLLKDILVELRVQNESGEEA